MFKLLGVLANIVDKFVPTQNGRRRNELRKLEKELEEALIDNDDLRAATVRKRMSELRKDITDTG